MKTFLEDKNLPEYRQQQMRTAWFDPSIKNWEQVTTLPKEARQILSKSEPWSSLKLSSLQQSKTALKALFELSDGKKIESVLMINPKGDWTACLSSEVGCAMACDFCATGTMGFIRDLSSDEVSDQLRYWRQYLHENEEISGRVSNIVMMGMGEPLNNYEPVRDAIIDFIEYMEIGKTKITLSTVGVKRGMEQILTDPLWPDVRVAISLHYPDQKKRVEHMPVANQRSLEELKDWCLRYLKQYGNRKHHITFEYLMLEGKNDTQKDVRDLAKFLKGIDRYKINLIPWNEVDNLNYNRASRKRTEGFQEALQKRGIRSTIRKSLGREIDGGCGQLAVKEGEVAKNTEETKDDGLISIGFK
ncbi:MAG: 23S rRNA (adenine(2503)-C(2))-methyltransferase RlmN [Candidatus Gracilibacteria bacterium]|nr:23S rRNA (adenine(2503)-C(2))-methyltransferase RlmN [Candidatus Gracilibacteria bacterium]